MQQIEQGELPAGLRGGRLEGVQLPDLMWALCGRRATGVLGITRSPITRKLYLQDGRIVFASSSDPNDRLGEILLRKGQITLDQLEAALSNLRSGKRLGVLLVDSGTLDADQLVDSVIHQVKAIALDVLSWEEGAYRFDPGELPTDEVITLQMHTAELLMQGIRNIRSFSRIRVSVGAPQTAFCLSGNRGEILEGLRLTEGERLLLERLEGGRLTIEALCDELTLSNFEIYRTMWAFKILGLVAVAELEGERHAPVALTGRVLGGSFPEILVEMSRSRTTGVLYASRRSVERSFHLDRGRCVFATSTYPDDGLVSFLLRRGVISLRDREETRKRLLSNKRVGIILRDMGVLDAEDLTLMVRQQLSEIVHDTFLWEDGDFRFVPGPLPSNEQITLDVDVARLVSEGVRRVDSWTRVIQGCGGVDNPLSLDPRYLELLDRMGAGVEEMEVVNTLKYPQSPRRICRLLPHDDFRICQILWSLKLLGGVETARVDLNEPIPEDVPAPEHTEIAAAAVGQHTVDSVCAALVELPDSAELISRQAVDVDQIPRTPSAAAPLKRSTVPPASSPEMLDLDDPTGPAGPPTARAAAETSAPAAERPAPQADAVPADPVPLDVPLELEDGPESTARNLAVDLEAIIGRFNAMHRLVYRAVRSEIGAGAVNFVRSCCGQAAADGGDLLVSVELEPDGSWNVEELKNTILDNGIADPWPAWQQVLDREFVLLAPHLGQDRATDLKARIWSLQYGDKRPT